jgi:putative metalloprotease
MKKRNLLTAFLLTGLSTASFAQIKLNNRAVQAASDGVTAATFSDADARKYAKEAIDWMDAHNTVAGSKDPYTIRLNKLVSKLPTIEGLTMNYKVYKVVDVNAFACADGSVRVFSSLMDILSDDELIGVIGHEIGHVANHDSRDAIKAAYTRSALSNAAASQSGAAAVLTDTQVGQMANELLNAKHSRKQESQADDYSYDFMKKNNLNVMGLATAFQKFAKMEDGTPTTTIEKLKNDHPDSQKRADEVIKKAKKDGLYKEATPAKK